MNYLITIVLYTQAEIASLADNRRILQHSLTSARRAHRDHRLLSSHLLGHFLGREPHGRLVRLAIELARRGKTGSWGSKV